MYNMAKKSNLKILFLCFVCIMISVFFSPKHAPGITVQEEEEMSREFMKVVLKHFEFIEDPVVVNYLNDIGKKIVSILPPQPFSYRFYVIKEDAFNAFASPAGNIFVNSGLLVVLENEEELAGVLAHEIAHVVSRHISHKIERSKKIGVVTLAGVVAGMLLGAGGAAAAANAVTVGSMAAGQSMALAYSREDEAQADQICLDWLTRAGYSGDGMLSMLKKMRSQQWFGPDQVPTYLRTHPASEERMAFIDTWLEKNRKRPHPKAPYDFERAHTWMVAMHGDENTALRKFESDVKDNPSNPFTHYGYGLVLAKTGNRKEAAIHLKIALEKRAFDPYILKDLGRIYFLDGNYSEALHILASANSIASSDPEGLFYLGRTQLELGRLDDAANTFEELIKLKSDYTPALYFLGETYGKIGRLDDAHYYLGMYYQKKFNLKTASFHFKRALENESDPGKKAKIEEMLEKIRKERKLAEQNEDKEGRKQFF